MKIKINKGLFGLKTKYLNEAILFAEDYRNSPGFNERWNRIGKIPGTYRTKNSVYNPLSQYEHKLLWKKGEFKKGKYIPWKKDPKNSMYKYGNGDFYIGISKTPGKAFSNWEDVLTHEAGHYLEESLNNPTLIYKDGSYYPSPLNFYSEIYPIFRKSNSYKNITDIISEDEETARNYNKKPVTESWNFNYDWGTDDLHDASPSESYADLFLLRKKLLDSGIYDSRKANNLFKQEHLDKFKKLNKNKIRLFDNFSDKDIIWMMNNIAQNNKILNNLLNYYAKNGGSIKAANARKWKHQQGGIMDYLTWSNMSVGDLWKYRLNRTKALLLNPNIENVWEAGKTIVGGNDPENPNMNLMTAPDILPGKINPGFSILKVRSFKFPAITNEVEAAAAKDWMLSLGYRPNPKGNPIKIEANPSNKVIKKEEMFKTNEKHYKLDWLEDREYGVSKSKRKAFKTAEAMESGDARRINSGYTNLKKAQLNLVEMNLHKYPQFELKAYEKGLKNIYRRGGDKDALKKYKREFFKRLAGLYGYFKEGGYIQLNLLPIINISDIDASHNGWEEFSKEFLNKLKEEYLKKKLLELQQIELEGNLFGNFLLTGLGKVFDLIGSKKSSDTLPSTSTLSTLPSSNYLSNNLNFGVKSIFGTY